MRRVGAATLLVVVALTAGCSDESSPKAAAQLPTSCELASVRSLPPASDAISDAPVVASVSNFIAMSGYLTVSLLTLRADGDLVVLGSDDQQHHVRLAPADVARVQRCVDESGFLDLDEEFKGATTGRSGDKFCVVADAADTTVTAIGSFGISRTATGTAPAFADTGCDFGYPVGLLKLHAAMDQLRTAAST